MKPVRLNRHSIGTRTAVCGGVPSSTPCSFISTASPTATRSATFIQPFPSSNARKQKRLAGTAPAPFASPGSTRWRQATRTQRSSSVVTPTRVPSLLLSPRVRGIRFTIRSTEAQASRRFSSRRLVRATSARHRIRHGKVYAAEWRAWRGHCQVNEPGPGCGELLRESGRGHLGPHGE